MRRRHYLAGTVTALTGCLGSDRRAGDSTPTPLPALPESVARTVRVVRADEIPGRYHTTATVDVVEPRITTDHTARLRVTVRNTDEEGHEYVFDPNPPMGHERSVSGPTTLVLVAEGSGHERVSPDCWRPSGGGVGDGAETVTLAPGESVENTLEVWDAGDGDCLPPGEYAFRRPYPTFEDLPPVDNTWSFTLGIERS